MLPVLREHHYTYCIPVISGRNVWVGANVSILPGVTIGDNCVITPEGKPENFDDPLYFIRDGVVVIPKNGIIPHGTKI